jgi:hypothetical protein
MDDTEPAAATNWAVFGENILASASRLEAAVTSRMAWMNGVK